MGSFSNFNSAHLNLILSKDKQQFFDIKVEKTSYLHQGAMSPHARESKIVKIGF